MRHTIRGRYWIQRSRRLTGKWGWCDYQKSEIAIDRRAKGFQRLDTLIHEFLHAAFPDMDEEAVTESATDMARYLTRNGFTDGEG